MLFIKIKNKKIRFKHSEYSLDLFDSIKEKGILIPVRVNFENNEYICIDGNKRLSVIKDLYGDDRDVDVVIVNNYQKAGSAYWGNTRNKH